jgi:hypothetical protein
MHQSLNLLLQFHHLRRRSQRRKNLKKMLQNLHHLFRPQLLQLRRMLQNLNLSPLLQRLRFHQCRHHQSLLLLLPLLLQLRKKSQKRSQRIRKGKKRRIRRTVIMIEGREESKEEKRKIKSQ